MFKGIAVVFLSALFVSDAWSQPLPPPPPNQAVSLDVIVGLLLFAGLIYGLKKLTAERVDAKP